MFLIQTTKGPQGVDDDRAVRYLSRRADYRKWNQPKREMSDEVRKAAEVEASKPCVQT